MAERVSGPFKHGNRWRNVISRSVGGRTVQEAFSYETEAAARRDLDRIRLRLGTRTVETAWEAWEASRPLKRGTRTTNSYRIRGLLGTYFTGTLQAVTPGVAARLYRQRAEKKAGDTQLSELSLARGFWAFCVSRAWVKDNPWDLVEAKGSKRSRPKDQLRLDEARRLLRVALGEGSREGLAVATALLMGLRCTEIVARVVRDVDDGGRLLWIPDSKTAAGVRQVVIPDVLHRGFTSLVRGKRPSDSLWGLNERGRPVDRHWLEHHSIRLCDAARVPRVRPHALRGLHATLATVNGTAVEVVARALGHAGTKVTRQHYIARGAEANARTRDLSARLRQG